MVSTAAALLAAPREPARRLYAATHPVVHEQFPVDVHSVAGQRPAALHWDARRHPRYPLRGVSPHRLARGAGPYRDGSAAARKGTGQRNLHIATLSFDGTAHDPSKYAEIEKSAREACRFLQRFGATEPVVFSPRRINKVLEREHIRRACQFYNHLGDACAEYGIRPGLHNHSQGQPIESQDEIEMLLNWTDPRKFHRHPDTLHLYMANCGIPRRFRKHAHRLIFFDLVDARYEYQTEDTPLPNGKIEKAGSQNGTFVVGNRDYGDGEVDLPEIMRIVKSIDYKGWINIELHYARISPRHSFERCMKYIREKLDPIYR